MYVSYRNSHDIEKVFTMRFTKDCATFKAQVHGKL